MIADQSSLQPATIGIREWEGESGGPPPSQRQKQTRFPPPAAKRRGKRSRSRSRRCGGRLPVFPRSGRIPAPDTLVSLERPRRRPQSQLPSREQPSGSDRRQLRTGRQLKKVPPPSQWQPAIPNSRPISEASGERENGKPLSPMRGRDTSPSNQATPHTSTNVEL